jgi:hypothetical protein
MGNDLKKASDEQLLVFGFADGRDHSSYVVKLILKVATTFAPC